MEGDELDQLGSVCDLLSFIDVFRSLEDDSPLRSRMPDALPENDERDS